ncbi:unnamed protein product [Clonostachys rosea f. rosea IK726]|uniref:Uncharacterized protein n=1 Tax=Clonostachys rosea f. rosea IK726 TaxID=1349383 RepID=A0ACA9TX61_BIOOC|nr:unnamed protein product [Clonostachys rosea f. rosea IK726]
MYAASNDAGLNTGGEGYQSTNTAWMDTFNNLGLQIVGRSLSSGIVAELVDGSEITYKAKEVILAAGGPMTPQILEISGIGSRTLLESHGIPIIVDNPIVGENLQDHSLALPLADHTGTYSAEARKEFLAANQQHIKFAEDTDIIQAGDEPIVEYMLFHGQTNTAISEPKSLIDYLAPVRPEITLRSWQC